MRTFESLYCTMCETDSPAWNPNCSGCRGRITEMWAKFYRIKDREAIEKAVDDAWEKRDQ